MKPIGKRCSAALTLALLCALTLTACGGPRITGITGSAACVLWQPLSYSASKDTRETQAGIAVNNAKRKAFCKGDKQ